MSCVAGTRGLISGVSRAFNNNEVRVASCSFSLNSIMLTRPGYKGFSVCSSLAQSSLVCSVGVGRDSSTYEVVLISLHGRIGSSDFCQAGRSGAVFGLRLALGTWGLLGLRCAAA